VNDLKMYRVTGIFGVAMVVFWLSQFPLYMQGDASISVYDGAAVGRSLYRIHNIVFTRLLLDMGLYITGMIFAAGFRDLIRRARPDYEWFGAWVVWIAVSLVANGLEGGSALDTLSGNADPSAIRALTEGTLLIYNGSIAFAMTALFLGAAGYATFGTSVLPRWTGWLAYSGVALCLGSIPAIFGGPVDSTEFYNAGGWGPAIMANFPPAIWFVAVSLSMLLKREERPHPYPGNHLQGDRERLLVGAPDSSGLAMTVDYEGKVLAAVDDYTTDPQVMVACVPTHGVRTIYAMLGDWFAWISIVVLVALIAISVGRRRTVMQAEQDVT